MDTATLLRDFGAGAGSFGLVLPDGWCGRPHDNLFTLHDVRHEGGALTLDLRSARLAARGPVVVTVEHGLAVVADFTSLTFEMDVDEDGPRARGRWEAGVVVLVGDPFARSPLLDVGPSASVRSGRTS